MSAKSAQAATPAEQPSEPAAPEATELATQLETVSKALVQIDAVSAGIAQLRAKYHGVLFEVTTTKGMKEACEARAEIREPRYEVEKLRKAAKRPIIDLGKKLDTEAERITNELLAIEGPVDQQIKTEEARKEAERQAKAEAERQRIAAIQSRIDEIRQRPADAAGQSVAEIELYVRALVGLEIDDTFAELKQMAVGAKATSLIRLRAALTKAQAMEAERDRLAAERLENERIRQENEARAAALEAHQAAENKRLAAIRERIQSIRAYPDGASLKSAAAVQEMLDSAKAMAIDESFAELRDEAQTVLDDVVRSLANVYYERKTHEEEQTRLAAERARIAKEERERQEAREAEDRRIAAERAEAERIEAERQAVREVEERRLADARAQLERDQETLRLAQERAAAPAPVDIPAPESASVAQATEEPADPLLMTIRLTEWLPMQSVCKAAQEWAVFQDPDSKAGQKTDRKLAARARESVNNLLIAVEQLL